MESEVGGGGGWNRLTPSSCGKKASDEINDFATAHAGPWSSQQHHEALVDTALSAELFKWKPLAL